MCSWTSVMAAVAAASSMHSSSALRSAAFGKAGVVISEIEAAKLWEGNQRIVAV